MNTIAVTRPVGEGGETEEFIRGMGWNPFIVHTIELKPYSSSEILDHVKQVIPSGPVDWLVFMSSRGVELLFETLRSSGNLSTSILGQCRVAAVGPRTRDELVRQGVENIVMPDRYSSEGISELLTGTSLEYGRVALVRSSEASTELADILETRGAKVQTIKLYRSLPPSDRASVLRFLVDLKKKDLTAVLFTSAVSARNLFKMAEGIMPQSELVELLESCLVGAIGPVTQRRLQELGLNPIVPSRYLIGEAIKLLIETCEERRNSRLVSVNG